MNKDIQKERMKKCFIDAAKEILVKEGVSNVSVRRVGDATGYSYATIYNYFENLDHLLWHVGLDFKKDIIRIFENEQQKDQYPEDMLKELSRKYMNYYFGNPNVFRFFFFYGADSMTRESIQNEEGISNPRIEKMQMRILESLAEQKGIEKDKVPIVSGLIMNSIHGMLLMYFSKNRKVTEEEMINTVNETIHFLINKVWGAE